MSVIMVAPLTSRVTFCRLTSFVLGFLTIFEKVNGAALWSRETVTDEDKSTIKLWPNGIIPYNISDGMYDEKQMGLILSAMKRWQYKTCIKFVPWSRDMGYTAVNFFSVGSCFSSKGRDDKQPQLLGLGPGCLNMFIVMHELGHVVGLAHEMERADRDLYIDVIYDNMNAASVRNFHITNYPQYNTPYDYKSIMHYGSKSYSVNKKPTIVTRDPAYYHVIGSVRDVSFFDALRVNRAYSCSATCPASLQGICENGGFLGGPDCRCICQDGYGGQLCEQTLPGYQHILHWTCQKGWMYHEGKCYMADADGNMSHTLALTKCTLAKGSLVTFKGRPEMAWINHFINEQKLMTGVGRFWIGLTKDAGDNVIKWADDTLVDTNLVSVDSEVSTSERGCGIFDGESVSLESCDTQIDVGYICEKTHDSTCGGRYIVTSVTSSVMSPNFPNFYPSDLRCTYVLQTNEDSRIKIEFDATSQLEESTDCTKDYLAILLSNDVTQESQKYCHNTLQGTTLTSEGNLAILSFKTNSRLQFIGFKAYVTEVKPIGYNITAASIMNSIRKGIEWSKIDTTGDKDKQEAEVAYWNLRALFDIMKSMTFSKWF